MDPTTSESGSEMDWKEKESEFGVVSKNKKKGQTGKESKKCEELGEC